MSRININLKIKSLKNNFFGGRGWVHIHDKQIFFAFFWVVVPFSTYFFLKQDGVPNFLFRPPVVTRIFFGDIYKFVNRLSSFILNKIRKHQLLHRKIRIKFFKTK